MRASNGVVGVAVSWAIQVLVADHGLFVRVELTGEGAAAVKAVVEAVPMLIWTIRCMERSTSCYRLYPFYFLICQTYLARDSSLCKSLLVFPDSKAAPHLDKILWCCSTSASPCPRRWILSSSRTRKRLRTVRCPDNSRFDLDFISRGNEIWKHSCCISVTSHLCNLDRFPLPCCSPDNPGRRGRAPCMSGCDVESDHHHRSSHNRSTCPNSPSNHPLQKAENTNEFKTGFKSKYIFFRSIWPNLADTAGGNMSGFRIRSDRVGKFDFPRAAEIGMNDFLICR